VTSVISRGLDSEPMPVFLFDLDRPLVDSVYQHVLAWREDSTLGWPSN
jgi:hypothetical protein